MALDHLVTASAHDSEVGKIFSEGGLISEEAPKVTKHYCRPLFNRWFASILRWFFKVHLEHVITTGVCANNVLEVFGEEALVPHTVPPPIMFLELDLYLQRHFSKEYS